MMKMRNELKAGLLIFAVIMVLKQFIDVPEFITGLTMGMSICLMLISLLPDKVYFRIKSFKRSLIK